MLTIMFKKEDGQTLVIQTAYTSEGSAISKGYELLEMSEFVKFSLWRDGKQISCWIV